MKRLGLLLVVGLAVAGLVGCTGARTTATSPRPYTQSPWSGAFTIPSNGPSRVDTTTALRLARASLRSGVLTETPGAVRPQKVQLWFNVHWLPTGGWIQSKPVLAWSVEFDRLHHVVYNTRGDGSVVTTAWVVLDAQDGHTYGTGTADRPASAFVPTR